MRHPVIEGGLGLGHGGEATGRGAGPLGPQGLVEALALTGGGRRVGRREQVADAVFDAEAVEAHGARPGAEASGEALTMDDALRQSGHYGPRVAVSDDADIQTKLLSFIGRIGRTP